MPVLNTHEYAARQAKAAKLVGALASVGIPAHKARLMTAAEWASVAKCAGCRVPSDTTKLEVYQQLEDMVKPRTMTAREWIDKSNAAFQVEPVKEHRIHRRECVCGNYHCAGDC